MKVIDLKQYRDNKLLKDEPKTLFILVGLLCSGKSTDAPELRVEKMLQ